MHDGKRAWPVVAIALAAILSANGATRSLDGLIDAVIRNGPDSQLPAHLSVVLGVSKAERSTAVKQAVIRDGSTVRSFNVCTAHHDDVVLMSYNEQSRSMKAYVVSAAGELRKAVSYQAGAPANERSLADARSDFAAEIEFWTNLARRPAAPN